MCLDNSNFLCFAGENYTDLIRYAINSHEFDELMLIIEELYNHKNKRRIDVLSEVVELILEEQIPSSIRKRFCEFLSTKAKIAN